MKTVITLDDLPEMFEKVADKMSEQAIILCEMDARLGDGDLGLTMKKGFSVLPDIIREQDDDDIGNVLTKAGMKMASIVPSTMGTLMASGIMSGGKSLVGKKEIRSAEFIIFLQGFCEGIIKRGKCQRGDCTVLDAIAGALDFARGVGENCDLSLTVNRALEGAKVGAEATKIMRPKFGKAAVHAHDANGVMDQGACAGLYMIEGIFNYISL